jgi:hypothetical protein
MIIRGLRGVGKTVLLNAFEDRAEAEGFLTYYHELTPESGLLREIARDTQVALTRLDLGKRVTAGIRDALAHLSAIKVSGPEGIEISLDLKRADEAALTRELSEPSSHWATPLAPSLAASASSSTRCSSLIRSSSAP